MLSLSFFITFPRLLASFCHASPRPSPSFDRLVMLTVCCQQILDHMDESGVYNESDLAPFHRRLAELRWVACPRCPLVICSSPHFTSVRYHLDQVSGGELHEYVLCAGNLMLTHMLLTGTLFAMIWKAGSTRPP